MPRGRAEEFPLVIVKHRLRQVQPRVNRVSVSWRIERLRIDGKASAFLRRVAGVFFVDANQDHHLGNRYV